MTLAFAAVVGAWSARNAVAVGKFGLTEEYGSAALIERFAYDDMTAREFFQAFAYCVPGIGDLGFDLVYGTDSMHRFVFHTPGSFFHAGRDRRDALEAEHGRLDPLIGGIIRDEMRANWWRYLLVSIPLAWCGMWAGWLASLVLIPLFACACVRAVRASQPLLLLYAAPAVAMLGSARRRGEPDHPLQPDPHRPVRGRGGLARFRVAVGRVRIAGHRARAHPRAVQKLMGHRKFSGATIYCDASKELRNAVEPCESMIGSAKSMNVLP